MYRSTGADRFLNHAWSISRRMQLIKYCAKFTFQIMSLFRAIKYHRAMGVIFWIFATLHMLLFEIKWIQSGVLIQNAWSEVLNAILPLQQSFCCLYSPI